MQVDFATSGGLANLQLNLRTDTDTLPEDQAQELVRLIESSGVFDLEEDDVNPNVTVGRTDMISYRLSLSDGSRQTTLWLTDVTAPASVRPLLAFLWDLALARRKTRNE